MNLTISQKGLILVLLPLLFQLIFVVLVVRLQSQQAEAQYWTVHTKEVIAGAREVHTQLADALSATRGFAITRDPEFTAPFHRADRDLPALFDTLGELVGDNSEQTAQARAIRADAIILLDWLRGIVLLPPDKVGDEGVARLKSGSAKRMMDDLRRKIDELITEEERLDQIRAESLAQSQRRMNAVFAGGGIVAVVSTFLTAFLFRRGISRRFTTLTENTLLLADGKSLPPLLSGNDEIARLDRAFRDMAAELTHAAERVRDLYDSAPCGYHSIDPDGTFIAINRTELEWLGYKADEVVGRMKFKDLLTAASRDQFLDNFTRFKEQGTARDLEFEVVRKDGSVFPVLLNATAIRDSDGRYLASRSTVIDLTERKRTEDAVRLFADVVENIPLGLLIYQLDGTGDPPTLRVRSANPGAVQLLGVPLDQAAGRAVIEVFPSIPPEQLRRYTNVATSGVADDLGEFRYGDGRVLERWWAVQAFALPERSVGVAFQDISGRKQAEAEVRRLTEELEDRIRQRTAELTEANRDLTHKNSENEMFVYSVSHDLRSPLVNLQGFSKEIEKGCRGLISLISDEAIPASVRDQALTLLNGKMAKALGFIQSAVMRLSGIIDAMLRLSRAGRVEYRLEVVDVQRIVARVVESMQGTISERSATVTTGELPPAWGDSTAIEQVFGNLIGNALTYLDPARPGVIEVGCKPPGSDGVPDGFRGYYVRDNGLGIAEGHRAKIFQAFQRAHPGVGKGEGLGLAIVSRVAERHRGRVWVESKVGEGSTFYVALPIPPMASGSR